MDVLEAQAMRVATDVTAIVLLILISLSARYALVLSGQRWIMTFAHTATLTLLPIITFVITKVISGNIALSLGMVGALSIVRFRNPVKSPLELSTYFASITMGIAASVSINWLLFLVGAIALAFIALKLANWASERFRSEPFFQTSFSEGNQMSTLEVHANAAVDVLSRSDSLISETHRDGAFTYILASPRFDDLRALSDQMRGMADVTSSQLNK